jgi:HSP20 family molecular chaperone IbpA
MKGLFNMKTELQKKPETAVGQAQPQRYRRPHYEVNSDKNGYDVLVFMPGVNRKGATVTVEKGTLTVEGQPVHELPEAWRPLHRELTNHAFRLQLRLNVEVDEDAIVATSEEGILKVRLPIAEAAKPRVISID